MPTLPLQVQTQVVRAHSRPKTVGGMAGALESEKRRNHPVHQRWTEPLRPEQVGS